MSDVRNALAEKPWRGDWNSTLQKELRPSAMKVIVERAVGDSEKFVPVAPERMPRPVLMKRRSGSFYVGAFTDRDVERGEVYRYRIRLIRPEERSAFAASEVLRVEVHDGRRPDEVRGLSTEATTESITISWQPLSDPEVLGYRVYRRLSGQEPQAPTERAAPPTLDGALGPQLAGAQLDVPVTSSIHRDWLRAARPRLAATSALRDLRMKINQPLGEVGPSVNEFVDDSAVEGEVYEYSIVAFDEHSGEGASRLPVVATLVDGTPPAPPRSPEATPSEGGVIEVAWSRSLSDDVRAYRVYRETNGGTPVPIRIVPADGDLRIEDRLHPYSDDLFAYTLVAYDEADNASDVASTAVVELPDIRPPGPPVITALDTGSGFVTIRWIAPPDADVEGFRVIRTDAQGNERVLAGDHQETEFEDRDVLIGGYYEYRLEAFDEVGNRSEPSESHRQRVVGPVVAEPPRNLRLVDRRGRTSLRWQPIEGYAETSYVVMAGSGARGPFVPISAPVSKPELLLPPNLGPDTYLTVVARYFNGDVSEPSTPTNTGGAAPFGKR